MVDNNSIDDFLEEPKKALVKSSNKNLEVIADYEPSKKDIAYIVAKDIVKSLSPFYNLCKDVVSYVKDLTFYFSKSVMLGLAFPLGAQDKIGTLFYNHVEESFAKYPSAGSMFAGSVLGCAIGLFGDLIIFPLNPKLFYISLATNSIYWGYKGFQKLNEKSQEVKQKLIEEHNKKMGLLESSSLSIYEGKCPVCGQFCEEIKCEKCNTLYHKDCWDYIGGCSIYGCKTKK